MKPYLIAIVAICLAALDLRADGTNSAPEHATALGKSLLQLLEVGDVDSFANAHGLTNRANRMGVMESSRLVLDQASRLGLDPSRIRFRLKEVLATATTTAQNPQSNIKGDMLPSSFGIRIILAGEPVRDIRADQMLRGEYELAVGGAFEFPDGWRTFEGIRWSRFPALVADERMNRELQVISNVATRFQLRAEDDPGLLALGTNLIRFLKDGDEKIFTNEVMSSFDELWEALSKKQALLKKYKVGGGMSLPSKKVAEESLNLMRQPWVDSVREVLAKTKSLGIDFSEAQVTLKDAIAERAYMRGGYGAVEGLTAGPLRFVFSVKSDQISKAGIPIAGEYVLTTPDGERGPVRWTVQGNIRWERLPDGLLAEKEVAKQAFENYVGDNAVLPPGTAAPDIEFVGIDGKAKLKLSDFRDKVVVMEWWATWCGPCQAPMAELQTLQAQHPEWKDRVKIIALSIDDELAQAQAHLAKRGWTNTYNAWAGSGGWMSTPAKQFRLHGVPTCYVIKPGGIIEYGGSPLGPKATNMIAGLLR